MKRIASWLKTPYYFNPSSRFKLKISFFFGLFVFLFLYIFRPFYLSQFTVIILEYTIGIGSIAFLGTFFMIFVPPLIFKDYFNEDKWTVGRNLFLILIGVIFIGSFLWYFGEMYKEPYHLRKLSLLEYLTYTLLVSSLPLTFFVFSDERKTRYKRQKRIDHIRNLKEQKKIEKNQKLEEKIIFYSENKRENLTITVKNLVYVTSQGNYASFFIRNEEKNGLKEKILRVTLTKIEEELKDYPNIVRCHKSYIVNTKFIIDISGNARGYLLKSNLIYFNIPVSRSFSKQSLQSLLN
jgi:hypothetical protein